MDLIDWKLIRICTLCRKAASPRSSFADSYTEHLQVRAMIAQQRSQSLYDCVSDGAISLDAILALPIDWQGIAIQQQWSEKAHKKQQPQAEPLCELIRTRSPLQVKRAIRSRRVLEEEEHTSTFSLGLTLDAPTASSPSSPALTLSDDAQLFCPPSPTLTNSGYTSHSDEESSVSKPDPDVTFTTALPHNFILTLPKPTYPHLDAYNNFPLKSFCSAFSDNEEDEIFAWQ